MRGLPQKSATPPAPALPSSLTREEFAKRLVGQVATFYAKPGAVVHGLPIPGAKMHVGQIIAAEFSGLRGKGQVPDYKITIRGRTGKTAAVSTFENHVSLCDTWNEAIAKTNPPTP
jgi:hypothetical protein